MFFPLLKTGSELIDFDVSASTSLVFYLFHMGKMFPFEDFFSSRKANRQKKGHRMRLGEWGGWGTRVMMFLVENCCTLNTVWAGVFLNHPS